MARKPTKKTEQKEDVIVERPSKNPRGIEYDREISSISASDAAKIVAELTPFVGDVMAAKEIFDETQKEDPNWFMIGALGGAAVVGLIPGIGDAASALIKRGAKSSSRKSGPLLDEASKTISRSDLDDSIGRSGRKMYDEEDVLEADDLIFSWEKGEISNAELRNKMKEIGFPIDTKRIMPKKTGEELEVVNPNSNSIQQWKDIPLGFADGGAVDSQMNAVFKSSRVDPVSGNEVPPGSLPEEVRDDVPAMLSEGEYVVPADVLRYYGVKFFEDLRGKAKMDLGEMHQNGRIGGEPVAAARGTLVQRPRQYGDLGGRSVEDVIAEARRLFGPAKSQQGMDFGGKTEEQIRAEVASIFGKPQQKIQQQGGGVDTSTQPSMDSAISQAVSIGNNAVTSVNNNNIPTNVDQQMQEVFPENLDYKGKDITVSKLSDVADIVAQTAAALSQNKDQDFNPSLYGKDAVDVATDLGVDMMALSDAQNQPASNTSNQNMADEDTVMSQSVVSNKGYTPSNVDVASWSESKDAQPQVTPESIGLAVDMVEGVFSKNGFVPENNIQSIAELTGVPVSEVQGMVAAVSRSNQAEEVSYANPPSNSANLTGIESFMGNISGGTDVSQAEVDAVDMIGDLAAAGVFGMDTADTGTIGDIASLGGGNADGGNAGPTGGDAPGDAPGPSGPSGGPTAGGVSADTADDGTVGDISALFNKGGMVGYAEGGAQLPFNIPPYIDLPTIPGVTSVSGQGGYSMNTGGVEYRRFTNSAGMTVVIPFFNGQPLGVVPPGYFAEGEAPAPKEEQKGNIEDNFGGLADGGQEPENDPGNALDGLNDVNQDGKVDFGDTFLGDALGFDGQPGVQGPGLADSLAGGRRGGSDESAEDDGKGSDTADDGRGEGPSSGGDGEGQGNDNGGDAPSTDGDGEGQGTDNGGAADAPGDADAAPAGTGGGGADSGQAAAAADAAADAADAQAESGPFAEGGLVKRRKKKK